MHIISRPLIRDFRYYGAKFDGITDDTAAFQAGINDTPDGSAIIIPPTPALALAKITDSLQIGNKRIKIFGYGEASKISFVPVGNRNLFVQSTTNNSGCEFSDFYVSGSLGLVVDFEAFGYLYAVAGTAAQYAQNALIKRIDLSGMSGWLRATYLDGFLVSDCECHDEATGGNGVLGHIKTCSHGKWDHCRAPSGVGSYSLLALDDGALNLNQHIVLDDCQVSQMLSARYCKNLHVKGGKYWIANADSWGGAILITNGCEDTIVENVDARGAHGNVTNGSVLRTTDGAGRLTVIGGTFRSYGGIGSGILVQNACNDKECSIVGAHCIDESGTNPNYGIAVVPAAAEQLERLTIHAKIDGFTEGVFVYPAARNIDIQCVVNNAVTRSIYVNSPAIGDYSHTNIHDCYCDGIISINNAPNSSIVNNHAPVIQVAGSSELSRINGNTCISETGRSCYIQNESSYVDIQHNVVADNISIGTTNGIYNLGTHCNIANNYVMNFGGAGTYGIRNTGNSTSIVGNTFKATLNGVNNSGTTVYLGENNMDGVVGTKLVNTGTLFVPEEPYFRSGAASPVGVVIPQFVGEEYFNTAGPTWYKAVGLLPANWVAI